MDGKFLNPEIKCRGFKNVQIHVEGPNNLNPLSLFKEGLRNLIPIASLMWRLNALFLIARTFVLLESTEWLVSWQCS